MLSQSVHACITKIPQTRYLINNRNLFLTVLETGKSKIKALAVSVSGGATFWFTDSHLFPASYYNRRGRKVLGFFLLSH